MLADLGLDELVPVRPPAGERALLVGADQAAIAGDIGHEDGGESPLDVTGPHTFALLLGRIRGEVAAPHGNREFDDCFHCAPLIEKRPVAKNYASCVR
jgi:hypothetical protein